MPRKPIESTEASRDAFPTRGLRLCVHRGGRCRRHSQKGSAPPPPQMYLNGRHHMRRFTTICVRFGGGVDFKCIGTQHIIRFTSNTRAKGWFQSTVPLPPALHSSCLSALFALSNPQRSLRMPRQRWRANCRWGLNLSRFFPPSSITHNNECVIPSCTSSPQAVG